MDRMIKAVENFGLPGPVERWRKVRAQIHDEICHKGFDQEQNTFVQYYGGTELDASLLMIPLVGFLRPRDPTYKRHRERNRARSHRGRFCPALSNKT